ncbi:hypothetical protein Pmar_PMAR023838 [Perkinsus marinus ATCC 50983]|uniref:Uncharacterized protein n=1 Tax=Perkinsus marinus (strain ATCC 50983 / TXsc) TaxID=423536 RepID=C5LVW5_PERM5|nr:hypothetical protein Pmar_PMAR023838 [Perkinsus marinus ATCC 50983]EEQ99116.1 hypothetical protein Pmar_PMAR023838 [Perkinsus marinus ATCC 50983]|eukprot:XP_002766399.1 hypothetical protein Pmar_PMAR023838 [Perkinsus marinus ATCC 50983]
MYLPLPRRRRRCRRSCRVDEHHRMVMTILMPPTRAEEGHHESTTALDRLLGLQGDASPKLQRNISLESRELSDRISTAARNATENGKLFRTEKQRVNRSLGDYDDEEDSEARKINFGDEVNVRFFNRSGSSLSLRGRSHSQHEVADLASCVKSFDGRSNNKSCLGKTTSYENLGDLETIAEEMGKPREMLVSGRRGRSRSFADLEEDW